MRAESYRVDAQSASSLGLRRPKGSFDSSLRSSLRMTPQKTHVLMNNSTEGLPVLTDTSIFNIGYGLMAGSWEAICTFIR